MLRTKRIEPQTFPLAALAEWFREFYSGSPWGECQRCPRCSPQGDFGGAGRYADPDLERCLVCGAELEAYWSDLRAEEYFLDAANRPGFAGNVHHVGNELAGWTWGYLASTVGELAEHPASCVYIDVIGVLPAFRQYVLEVFDAGHNLARECGYESTVTRTRSDAKYVQEAMAAYGYTFLKPSSDGEREYWAYRL